MMNENGFGIDKALLVLLGIVSFIGAAILLYLFYPIVISFLLFIFPFLGGIILVLLALFLLTTIIYGILGFFVAIYTFFFQTVKVAENGEYTIEGIEESG